ncbi:hypothetical protein [Streptomyces sp. NPDC060194]|uniref:hypothetical protein n=1 Tax=Streptomyces sp. NPDC060194 TaxID=3347069 RepID=UPI0036549B3D
MAVTIPLVLLFGIALAVCIRFKAVGFGVAVLAALFGFYLADTDARTTVNDLTTAVTDALNDARP